MKFCGKSLEKTTLKSSPRSLATCLNVFSIWSCTTAKGTAALSTNTVPDSIFARSRISLINMSKSFPETWINFANSTSSESRWLFKFSERCSAKINKLLSGVRNSWDILERNSDLYLEVSSSCEAFSSTALFACSTSRFLISISSFCSSSSWAFSSNSWLVSRNSSCWLWSSSVKVCDCFSSSSVRTLISMVLITVAMDSESWSKNACLVSE